VISVDEHERSNRFYFSRDRHLFLLTRTLVRTTLSQYADISPAAWRFDYNPFGRPEIANPECAVPLEFNVSHTEGLLALAVANGRTIGVDAEETAARQFPLDVAVQYFSASETADVLAVDASAVQQQRLFEYWTLKEAYAKAKGLGLSLPLDKSRFFFESNITCRDRIRFHAADDAEDRAWRFWQLWPSQRHLVALCAGRPGLRDEPLTVKVGMPDSIDLTTLTPEQLTCQHSSHFATLPRSIRAAPWRSRSSIT
jgi:4'-phosphopantetheinyl transferase